MSSEDLIAQCPCGYKIKDSSEYNILFLKKELMEVDILCPNKVCYLGELGFIKFKMENDQPKLDLARFYSPYVTWNATRLGGDEASDLLKSHLKELIVNKINWNQIKRELKQSEEYENKEQEK
ncbi:MAG: hypothetical protein ACTSW1_13065 [Candidatus Hodarchaeales archaeon]